MHRKDIAEFIGEPVESMFFEKSIQTFHITFSKERMLSFTAEGCLDAKHEPSAVLKVTRTYTIEEELDL